MNAREKFLSNMEFEQNAPQLKWEYGYWAGVVRQWYHGGLPDNTGVPDRLGSGEPVRAEVMGEKLGGFLDHDIHQHFNMDDGFKRIPVNNFLYPNFETEILEDHGDWILWRNQWGITCRQLKDRSSPEAFVRSPVQSWEDWEQIKDERLQPKLEDRLPENWPQLVEEYRNRDFPLIIGGGQGFYGSPRYLLGD